MVSELMQPIISQHDVFVDIDIGPLVQGKVEIYDPVSNNPLNVYTYTEDEYVIAANPIILDVEGRPEQTIFSDRLSYIRVYAFKGYDENSHPIYQFIRDYYAGHNAQSEVTNNVTGIEALKDLDPAYNSQVTVIGYHNQFDCEPRTYIWDPNSTLDADNGYVIASDVSDTGRWILQFDGPYIPSSYYGVYPGQTANINALSTYIGEIHGKATAPGIFMIPGNYGDINMITTKKVLLFSNTKINSVECSWIDVKGKPTTWIGNIFPSDSTCPVHSSWYKHARSFWGCSSKQKYCDGHNWIDNKIVANMNQTNVTFYTDSSPALVTDTGEYNLKFTGCKLVGPSGFLHRDSKCQFQSMEFTDKYFVSINVDNITFNTYSSFMVTMDADNFKNVENMIKLYYKAGYTDIDCKNYACGANADVDLSEYLVIRNLNANNALVGKAGGSPVTMIDSKVNYLKIKNSSLAVNHSDIRITEWPSNFSSLNVSNHSTITGGWYLTKGAVTCVDSNWFMQINQADDNTSVGYALRFTNSNINATINTKNIVLLDCQINNSVISIYPYYEDSKYKLRLHLERCNINNVDNPTIQFKCVAGDNNVKNCWWNNVRIIGNDFQGNALGITCPFWTNTNWSNLFIARSHIGENNNNQYNTGFYVANNKGNCPKCADFRDIIQGNISYDYNSNLDWWCHTNRPLQVLGSSGNPDNGNVFRIWCQYRDTDCIGHTQGAVLDDYAIHGLIAEKRMPERTVIGNFNDQPARIWFDNWINNASFACFNVDSDFSGSRMQSAVNDWFAARIINGSDPIDLTANGFIVG